MSDDLREVREKLAEVTAWAQGRRFKHLSESDRERIRNIVEIRALPAVAAHVAAQVAAARAEELRQAAAHLRQYGGTILAEPTWLEMRADSIEADARAAQPDEGDGH